MVESGTALLWVHSDHLNRPVKMLDSAQNVVWEALYEPFGTVHSIVGTAANDNRFPGQLFQLETGLAYNWHRHYDATVGRYTQADPLSTETIAELLHLSAFGTNDLGTLRSDRRISVGQLDAFIRYFEQSSAQRRILNSERSSAALPAGASLVFPDGPSRYNYVRQSPNMGTDTTGLLSGGDLATMPNSNVQQCTDAPSMLLDDMALHRQRGGDICWALRDLRGRGVWGNDELRRAEKNFGCRGSSLSK